MLANRLPLLLAFAAGSLGTALVGFSRGETETPAAPPPRQVVEQTYAPPAPPNTAASDDHERVTAKDAETRDAAPATSETAPDAGNSVAEVLMRLEASYRQALAEPKEEPVSAEVEAPAEALATTATITPAPPATLSIASAPSPAAAVTPIASAPSPAAAVTPSRSEAAPTPAASATTDTIRATRAQTVPNATDVHLGDVHQNIYLGNVHHGDVLQAQRLELQQVAILQYLQLLALSQGGSISPERAHTPSRATPRRPKPFSMGLTNPDNPWGFDFPPTVLAK